MSKRSKKTEVRSKKKNLSDREMVRMTYKSFRDLIVWQKAHQFTLAVYNYTKGFPREELFGLSSQFRRAAVSVAANIAEGYPKRGRADKARYYNIAQGSLEECKYYIILAQDLGYGNSEHLNKQAMEVGRLLGSYISAIKTNK